MSKKGFTLIEMLIVIGILGVLATTLLLAINPAEAQKKSRDTKRLKDLATLQTILDEYISDGNPFTGSCLTSATGCVSSTSGTSTQACGSANWLGIDVCKYVQTVPVDPNNGQTRTFVSAGTTTVQTAAYRGIVTGSDYKLGVRQESTANRDKVTADGGVNVSWVEAGSNITGLLIAQ